MKSTITILIWVLLVWGGVCGPIYSYAAENERIEREYHTNGRPRLYVKFNGDQIVRKIAYYENGYKLYDYKYKNGVLVVIKNYYESGRLKSVWTRKAMATTFYRANGQVEIVVNN